MFCYQCEQTAQGKGCTKSGVCGKTPDVAALQDLLVYVLQGLSKVAIKARSMSIEDKQIDRFVAEGLFATVTNVDFDAERLVSLIEQAISYRETLKQQVMAAMPQSCGCGCTCPAAAKFMPAKTMEGLLEQARQHGVIDPMLDADLVSLKNTVLFGLKGMAAYVDHAAILDEEDPAIYHFMQESLAAMLVLDQSMEYWIDLVMQCGQMNLRTMELLDRAHNQHYGHPVPTEVPLGAKKGKAILISGHDLRDLELLLEQTEGKGIYIYTHGEMLPAHGYPQLKKHAHFHGHYGTAWQNQQKEFAEFPGAILMTTNCIQRPSAKYQSNLFTTGLVAWPGIAHIGESKDFTPVIQKALALPGFLADTDKGLVKVGFGHHAVLGLAGPIVQAVKDKKIRRFFLVAGCDGAKPGRNYYTEFVEQVPKDCVVLTLACGKFRFFDQQLGEIDGIPRLLDIGQCNDAYSAIQIAVALAKAFGVGINELPLSFVLSWYEQKAVVILLTLLSLGIKDIRLGPSLPAFLSPAILKFLIEKFNIQPITTPEQDLKAILG